MHAAAPGRCGTAGTARERLDWRPLHTEHAMNLPLHFGLLGSLEAGAIALLIGLLVFCGWRWLGCVGGCRKARSSAGRA